MKINKLIKQILPKVGDSYYEENQATCNAKKELEEA